MSELFDPAIREDVAAQQRVRDWITALRSGEYQQTEGKLREVEGGFCCLGVACDLLDSSKWALPAEGTYVHSKNAFEWGGPGDWEELPAEALEAYRVQNYLGAFEDEDGGYEELAALNDNGLTFAEIADIIERELNEVLA